MSGSAIQVTAPPGRGEPTPRPWLALIAALVLLSIGGGLWWFWPEGSSPDSAAPGRGTIGDAPALPGGSASVGTAAEDAALLVAPPSSAAERPAVELRPGALLVRTEIPQSGPLGYSVRVSINNSGDTSASWRSVALRLSGVNLTVTPAGTTVRYEFHSPAHCLVAAAPVALGPGESITLDATVTAVLPEALGGLDSARLDDAPCPA